ncbi:ribonuclease P protein component [Ehrlichia ruminantium]|uniref:Ribonuclease P protein component n=1 Tax=Ehrlichia ruminantium TaxID=779 RepID=A0A170RZZ5_EHRRU|nr:ribonuclease P protein component [Ehrlichia ruminantium]GAT75472.1 ribonuclease P protein component [Ehrlichia ruminantium]GAT77454.1 ribonuclease P protein component [Ehrlichia ruminantium]
MRLNGIVTIKKREDFLFAQHNGCFIGSFGLFLQVVRESSEPLQHDVIRVGFTVSKKVGNAVVRNKVKRRFRVLAESVIVQHARKGYYYILIASKDTPKISFQDMLSRLVSYLNTSRVYSKTL